jgi:hypothetical protein
VCPECGTSFDPGDPATWTHLDARQRRRRKWIVRSVVALLVGGAIYGVAPRQILTGSIAFTCRDCAYVRTTRRWEPLPPTWISARYPGFRWSWDEEQAAATRCAECRFDARVRAAFRVGSVSGAGGVGPGERTVVNGIPLSFDSAPEILEALMAPNNLGISIGTIDIDPGGESSLKGRISWRLSGPTTQGAP